MTLPSWLSPLVRNSRKSHKNKPLPRLARPLNLNVEFLEDRVVPTAYMWTGAGVNANWSNNANWAGFAAPVGDSTADLVFPVGAARTTNTDDINGGVFNSIEFQSDYTVN